MTDWASVGFEKKDCATSEKCKESAVHYEVGYVSAGVSTFDHDFA